MEPNELTDDELKEMREELELLKELCLKAKGPNAGEPRANADERDLNRLAELRAMLPPTDDPDPLLDKQTVGDEEFEPLSGEERAEMKRIEAGCQGTSDYPTWPEMRRLAEFRRRVRATE